jgi:hypothetical protein
VYQTTLERFILNRHTEFGESGAVSLKHLVWSVTYSRVATCF